MPLSNHDANSTSTGSMGSGSKPPSRSNTIPARAALNASPTWAGSRITDISVIRDPAHVGLALSAARAGMVLLRDGGLLPLPIDPVLVEFASWLDSGILESGGVTGFGTALQALYPHLPMVALDAGSY